MKVLLFTHKSDIDGMGGAVLATLAFGKVDYVLCETFSLQNEIAKYYDNRAIYDYDKIFVTDLWLGEPTLSRIANDKRLTGKFFVFDHHESALDEGCNKYPFVTIRISDQHGFCSGTSLFYKYLLDAGLIKSDSLATRQFVELTRRYDTWEWKTKYDDETPHQLSILFDAVGHDEYIRLMSKKLKDANAAGFKFTTSENKAIKNKERQIREKLIEHAEKVYYKQIHGYRAGIVFIDYEYRNDLAEYFRQNNFDMDFAMLIARDYGTISYRSVKEGINVRPIAEAFGGKGHDKAASSPIRPDLISALGIEFN